MPQPKLKITDSNEKQENGQDADVDRGTYKGDIFGNSEPAFKPQAKLKIGKSNDKYEQEADAIADKVVQKKGLFGSEPFFPPARGQVIQRFNESENERIKSKETEQIQEKPIRESITPLVQRQVINEIQEKESTDEVQRSSDSNLGVNPNIETKLASSKGGGRPMEDSTKNKMEAGFGTNFSDVKIHDDSNAVQMNKEFGSQAFANGNDIYFNEGKYNPTSNDGQHLLAHELTHTVQQSGGNKTVQKAPGDTKLEELDEMLGRFNVPEDDVIHVCGQLNGEEKQIVRTNPSYKRRMIDALNVSEMIRALIRLDFPLRTQLRWVNDTTYFGSTFLSYSEIKSLVTSASATEKNALKGDGIVGKSFFVGVCSNVTMMEALNDLGFDLVTKLKWLKAEMTVTSWELDYSMIKPWITAASEDEKNRLKTNSEVGKSFFTDVCTNQTMIEALDDLGFDLITKLKWLKAEVMITSWELTYATIKPWITHANTQQTERDKLKNHKEFGKAFFVAVCTNETMVEALNDLGFDLITKLKWLNAEMTITSWEMEYSIIKPWITAATPEEKNKLKTNTSVGKYFFVDLCTNTTMVEALNDLGFDLVTKLRWLYAEMTITSWELDYSRIKPWITDTNTTQAERNKLKTHWEVGKDFFMSVLVNSNVVEAVQDLKFDLKTKIEWVRAEAGLDEVKNVIELATSAERDSVWRNAGYLATLRGEVGDDYYLWVIAKLRMKFNGSVTHTSALDADVAIQTHLSAYVSTGVAEGRQIEGFVAVVDSVNWKIAGENHYGASTWVTKTSGINGFVDSEGRVWINKDAGDIGTMIHEGVHKYSVDELIDESQPLNEGVTEYFTRKVIRAAGIIAMRTSYGRNFITTTKLVSLVGEGVLAKAYFDGDVDGLETAFVAAKSASDWSDFLSATEAENWTLADGYL